MTVYTETRNRNNTKTRVYTAINTEQPLERNSIAHYIQEGKKKHIYKIINRMKNI
jgi:hypothetical protein